MAIKNAANIKAALVKYIDGKFRFQDAQTWTADEIKSLTDWLGSEGLNPFRLRTAKTALEEFVIACVQRYRNEHMTVWSKTEAEVKAPDGSIIRLYRLTKYWRAKRADLVPSTRQSSQRQKRGNNELLRDNLEEG